DVAAVKLSDWEEIQRGCKHPEPRGKRHRMHVDRVAVRDVAEGQPLRRFEEQRLTQFDYLAAGKGLRDLDDVRQVHSDKQDRHRDEETGNWPRNADVEERPFPRNWCTYTDKGAKRARQRERHREKVRS